MAKSIVLSDGYQIGEEWRSRTNRELKQIGQAIQSGTEFAFNQGDIDELLEQKKIIDMTSPSTWIVFRALMRVFRPILISSIIFGIVLAGLALWTAFAHGHNGHLDLSLLISALILIVWLPLLLGIVFAVVAIIVYGRLAITRLIDLIYSTISHNQDAKKNHR